MDGIILVVGHLAGLGHRRIAHIAPRHGPRTPRRHAQRPARRRLPPGHARTWPGAVDRRRLHQLHPGGRLRGAKRLLSRPDRPTAVFAGADIAAMGVLEAVAEAGLSVPDDISVAGYDNTTFAALGPISLTGVDP
ncbi:substrate-binding domain-containing protein [Streptomyces sp. DH10]|uniref:substrate-binding domain-containing protein n=1 Tax=Streptomyces sp. DH10 TaxID=3040121 RepID=UPI0024421154|nr:substrate-binding domain-containing protein [Streptomyces sp. DH10]MDG9707015.1 substrate-binding domain-containing protein [Streptomyces sp. DH10]